MRQTDGMVWQAPHRRKLFLLVLLLATACQAAPATPILVPLSPTPPPASDREAILALMAAEAKAVIHDDASHLLQLWATDGLVRDANHTPEDPSDDHIWVGHDALLSRYLTILFPLHLTQLTRTDVQLTIEGNTATATATTVIEGEISPGGERWTFTRIEGAWHITSIVFNLESP